MNQPAKKPVTPDLEKQEKKLPPTALKLAQHERNVWQCIVHQDTTLEDLLKPIYWTHIAKKLNVRKPFDKIEVIWEDGTKYVELIVISTGAQWAKVAVDPAYANGIDMFYGQKGTLQATPEAENTGYEVKWAGPTVKFAIVRVADNERIKEGFDTKEQAMKELTEFLKILNN